MATMKSNVTIVLIAIFIVGVTSCARAQLPLDSHLESMFKDERQQFGQAVELFLDAGLYRIERFRGDVSFNPPTANSELVAQLGRLLSQDLQVDLINANAKDGEFDTVNEIAFMVFRRGLVFAGEHKGIVYVLDDAHVDPIPSLDRIDTRLEQNQNKRLYKLIEPHWYIFYEYFP
jgi:hypothetical protein